MRIGTGFDVHAFGPGEFVMLGGVRVPHTRGVTASVVCAGNRSIASAGMSICGTPAPTRMRIGTVPA